MTFLPIVTRELRVAARRGVTYWQRAGAALGVILIGTWLYIVMESQSPQQLSTYLFGALTVGALFYALMSGLRATADCLSIEKREGTLGLLFLTDLKGYDVVFGKLAATSLNAFYSVLALVPVLAIPLLMGGLTPGEFERMALVTLNALFFSLSLGMLASSLSRSAQKAMALTALLLLILTALLPAFGGMAVALGKSRRLHWLLMLPSPGFAYCLAWDTAYRAQTREFWYSMLTTHGIGWFCLAWASVIAPRSWQDKPADARKLRWRERWRSWAYGSLGERVTFRRQLLDQNAFFWLAARSRVKPALVWAFLGLIACGWVWGLAKFRREWLNESVYVTTAFILNLTVRVWFAGEATRQLSDERRAGTLELLLSTPLTVRDILHGQLLALARQFSKPIIVIVGAEALFMWGTISAALDKGDQPGYWVLFWLAGIVMFLADLVALYWIGMWQGLTSRNPSRATLTSVSRVMVLPWVAYASLLLILALISANRPNRFEGGAGFFLAMWFFFGLATDLAFASHARYKLLTAFRLAAQQRYASGPLFRFLGLTYGKLKLLGQR
jgi:ABC-type transport system involved in multi-copper enzyme maturation permease subunit